MKPELRKGYGAVVPFPARPLPAMNRASRSAPKAPMVADLAFRAMLWLRKGDLDPARRIGLHASSEAPRSLGEVLSFMQLLWAVAHGLESTSKRMLSSVGVTGPQRLVLRLIGQYEGLSPGDLAEVLHVHPSSLTGMLRRLERGGWLRRRRHPDDGRRAVLTLTSRGRTLSDSQTGTVESKVRSTLRKVSPAKAAAAREVLKTLAKQLGVEARDSSKAAAPPKAGSRARTR